MKRTFIIRRHPGGAQFLAICLFGLIFSVRPLSRVEFNHELIHVAQQRELLYLPFFVCYLAEWLFLLCRHRSRMEAYRRISFEREAYRHQAEPEYLSRRKHYAMWRGKTT